MSGKVFLDTNIVVYLFSGDEPEKKATAIALIEHDNHIGSPVGCNKRSALHRIYRAAQ